MIEPWRWAVFGLLAIFVAVLITIKIVRPKPEPKEIAPDESSEDGPSIWAGLFGLIGMIFVLYCYYWIASGIYSTVNTVTSNIAATPISCSASHYCNLYWEGWLEPGIPQDVYKVRNATVKSQREYIIGWDNDNQSLFVRIEQQMMPSPWVRIKKTEQKRNFVIDGTIQIKISKHDRKMYAKVYVWDK